MFGMLSHFIPLIALYLINLKYILPPFQVTKLSSIAHVHIDVNKSRHTYIYLS
jgi:hypothetical protein